MSRVSDRLGQFEVIARGMKKGEKGSPDALVQSVISRHKKYAHAHQHLLSHIGAEKIGVGPKAIFKRDHLTFHIQPVFADRKKEAAKPKVKPMKEETSSVRILKEVVAKARKRILEGTEKPNDEVKDDKGDDDTGSGDVVNKGKKTLTGEKPDRINTDPELSTAPLPKGSKPAEPSIVPRN
jgi:hypothetical protein